MKENVIIGQAGTMAQTNKQNLGGRGIHLIINAESLVNLDKTAVKTIYGKQWHNGKVGKH